jgi:ethanolamine transporter EutH
MQFVDDDQIHPTVVRRYVYYPNIIRLSIISFIIAVLFLLGLIYYLYKAIKIVYLFHKTLQQIDPNAEDQLREYMRN